MGVLELAMHLILSGSISSEQESLPRTLQPNRYEFKRNESFQVIIQARFTNRVHTPLNTSAAYRQYYAVSLQITFLT